MHKAFEKVPSKDTIWKYLRISRLLQKEAKESLTGSSQFGVRHAKELIRLKDFPDMQTELAKEFAVRPMTVQQLKKKVDAIPAAAKGLRLGSS